MLKKLYIEPTTKCNLNCKMCFRHTWFDEPICDMEFEVFERILATMPESVETIFFGGMGEPLHHPRIMDMLEMASATGRKVQLLTNGTLLSEEVITGLIERKLHTLWVSVDNLESTPGDPAEGHGFANKVLENLNLFNTLRLRRESPIALGIAFVATKSNVHQLASLPRFIGYYMVKEVNISNIYPSDSRARDQMLYNRALDSQESYGAALANLVTYNSMYVPAGTEELAGMVGGMDLRLYLDPKVSMPYFDMAVPEAAKGIVGMLADMNFRLFYNDEEIKRKINHCRFIKNGMCFVRSDGNVAPCMALLHNGSTFIGSKDRTIYYRSFGSIKKEGLEDIWNSHDYRAFRKKFDSFDFSPCIHCGHCELVEDNRQDCIGNEHPTCGACLWAEGVLSCP